MRVVRTIQVLNECEPIVHLILPADICKQTVTMLKKHSALLSFPCLRTGFADQNRPVWSMISRLFHCGGHGLGISEESKIRWVVASIKLAGDGGKP
ncbi:MAG: hypothetical protein ACKO26_04285, partial [Planctomycetota bacterium]